jgi:hypothetical protein
MATGSRLQGFQTQRTNLGKFLKVLQWNMSVDFMTIWCGQLVYCMVIWYIFPVLVCCTEKNLATLDSTRWTNVKKISEYLTLGKFINLHTFSGQCISCAERWLETGGSQMETLFWGPGRKKGRSKSRMHLLELNCSFVIFYDAIRIAQWNGADSMKANGIIELVQLYIKTKGY